jgi:hypothetical protein
LRLWALTPIAHNAAGTIMANSPIEAAILAILREAHEHGVAPLLRTTLHKFVYLLDLYMAEESHGKTFTGADWRFHHFGPFAVSVSEAVDHLAAEKCLFIEHRESADSDAEFQLCTIWKGDGQSLRDVGVPGSVALRIASDLKRYSRNLPGLLDYVYFQTSPMEHARPRDLLTFEQCSKTPISDFKPIEMAQISRGKIKKTREKLREIASRTKSSPVETGPLDEAYAAGLQALDGEPLPIGLKGRAKIEPGS